MRRFERLLGVAPAVLAMVLSASAPGQAQAQCVDFNTLMVTVSAQPVIANYDPFVAGAATRSFTVRITNPGTSTCRAAISFHRPAGVPATMSSGGGTLEYSLVRNSDGSLIVTQEGFVPLTSPVATRRHNFGNIAAGATASRTVNFVVPTAQVVAAGTYADPGIVLLLVGLNASNRPDQVRTITSFSAPQAGVVSKCVLPAPSQPSIDLSSSISNGRPNEGVSQVVSFSNVQCTAPSGLRLTGAALQPTPSTGTRPGFDNFINFRARGTFGSASSTLTTTTTEASSNSSQKNTTSGATTNGEIAVDINLISGQPIMAGSYSGALTVSIDPSF